MVTVELSVHRDVRGQTVTVGLTSTETLRNT